MKSPNCRKVNVPEIVMMEGGPAQYHPANQEKAAPKEVDYGQKDTTPLIQNGTVLKNRYQVLQQIGGGGFGQIFVAMDPKKGYQVAIKAESHRAKMKFLRMEHKVLRKLQQTSRHVTQFFASGIHDTCNFIVMTLLGNNIMELKKKTSRDRFSIETAVRVAIQMLEGIRAVHEAGFIHRDIKPSNFAIGLAGEYRRRVYILDFGLCRQFIDNNGNIRQPRSRCGFRGTVRYASINIHYSRDMGRQDDIWSLFYLTVEMLRGRLPWRTITDRDEVLHVKETVTIDQLCENLPAEIVQFLRILKVIDYWGEIPYHELRDQLNAILLQLNVQRETPYDWEVDADKWDTQLYSPMDPRKRAALESGGPSVASEAGGSQAEDQKTVMDAENDPPAFAATPKASQETGKVDPYHMEAAATGDHEAEELKAAKATSTMQSSRKHDKAVGAELATRQSTEQFDGG